MSLLLRDQDLQFVKVTSEILTQQLENDRRLKEDLGSRGVKEMSHGIQCIVDILHIALQLEDENILEKHARWTFQLLCPLMSNCTRERIRDILVNNYEVTRSCMEKILSGDTKLKFYSLLNCAIQATISECDGRSKKQKTVGRYEEETTQYLDKMLQSDAKGAMSLIAEHVKNGIPLSDICVEIVAEAMRRVGELWHQNKITVDMEHYCTSVTQIALSQLYPLIFGQERNGKSVLVACVGSELHEIGARMVADLFEYNGWESIYLGAAVPVESLASAVVDHQPDLVALSVTMPQHLLLCREAVDLLRRVEPMIKIAVGGNAFAETDVWKKWDVDAHINDARELVKWADGAE